MLPTQKMKIEGYGEYEAPGVVDLVKDDKGVWSYTTEPLKPELYTYNMIVDGVKIIDPLNVKPADYALWFHDFENVTIEHVTGDAGVDGDRATKKVFWWTLKDLETGEEFTSDTTSVLSSEKVFLDRGISINIEQPWPFGPTLVGTHGEGNNQTQIYSTLAPNNGMLRSAVTYADSSYRWLTIAAMTRTTLRTTISASVLRQTVRQRLTTRLATTRRLLKEHGLHTCSVTTQVTQAPTTQVLCIKVRTVSTLSTRRWVRWISCSPPISRNGHVARFTRCV